MPNGALVLSHLLERSHTLSPCRRARNSSAVLEGQPIFRGEKMMVNRPLKRYSTSLIIRITHIKTTTRYHLTPVRMAFIKKNTTNAGKDMEKREPFYNVGGNVN